MWCHDTHCASFKVNLLGCVLMTALPVIGLVFVGCGPSTVPENLHSDAGKTAPEQVEELQAAPLATESTDAWKRFLDDFCLNGMALGVDVSESPLVSLVKEKEELTHRAPDAPTSFSLTPTAVLPDGVLSVAMAYVEEGKLEGAMLSLGGPTAGIQSAAPEIAQWLLATCGDVKAGLMGAHRKKTQYSPVLYGSEADGTQWLVVAHPAFRVTDSKTIVISHLRADNRAPFSGLEVLPLDTIPVQEARRLFRSVCLPLPDANDPSGFSIPAAPPAPAPPDPEAFVKPLATLANALAEEPSLEDFSRLRPEAEEDTLRRPKPLTELKQGQHHLVEGDVDNLLPGYTGTILYTADDGRVTRALIVLSSCEKGSQEPFVALFNALIKDWELRKIATRVRKTEGDEGPVPLFVLAPKQIGKQASARLQLEYGRGSGGEAIIVANLEAKDGHTFAESIPVEDLDSVSGPEVFKKCGLDYATFAKHLTEE